MIILLSIDNRDNIYGKIILQSTTFSVVDDVTFQPPSSVWTYQLNKLLSNGLSGEKWKYCLQHQYSTEILFPKCDHLICCCKIVAKPVETLKKLTLNSEIKKYNTHEEEILMRKNYFFVHLSCMWQKQF